MTALLRPIVARLPKSRYGNRPSGRPRMQVGDEAALLLGDGRNGWKTSTATPLRRLQCRRLQKYFDARADAKVALDEHTTVAGHDPR